jgi:CMP-N-acetylneuraminic acid synthetase
MTVVSVIPFWSLYQYETDSLKSRDTLRMAGKPLINYPIQLSNATNKISDTFIFTNDTNIKELIDPKLHFKILSRDINLDAQNVTIEAIIKDFFSKVDADVVVLLHPNSPFVSNASLEECIDCVLTGEYDSAFIARRENKFAWWQGKRLNYNVNHGTPHLSQIHPLILETSSLYAFTRQCFDDFGTRIGENPFIKEVGFFEGMVLTSPNDIKLAEFLLDSKFHD